MDARDEKLQALLPAIESPYSLDSLSEAEQEAFEEALGDGFGDRVARGAERYPLPESVSAGLLRHGHYRYSNADFEEDPQDAFWSGYGYDDDRPRPYESFPLRFLPKRLKLYFRNQTLRFKHHHYKKHTGDAEFDEWVNEERVLSSLYQKYWYEYHADTLLEWIEGFGNDISQSKRVGLSSIVVRDFSGQLGRLVEQYYWKFSYERAAISGLGVWQGARAGGKAKARRDLADHAAWQRRASDIWARHPHLTKMAVARAIRRQMDCHQTAKHIARYISKGRMK